MIIFWRSNAGTGAKPNPHVYIGLGAIALRINSPQALFNYTELAHLVSMKLSKTLFEMKV